MSSRSARLKFVLRDRDRKSLGRIAYELARCWLQERELPKYYFNRILYRKNVINYLDYVGDQRVAKLRANASLHDKNLVMMLVNKLFFSYIFRDTNVRVPRTLAHNVRGRFFAGGPPVTIDSPHALEVWLREITGRAANRAVFAKLMGGLGGKQSYRFEQDRLGADSAVIQNAFRDMTEADYIFQEVLVQHADIDRIYPNSINTVRVDTYLREDGEVQVISALMRFGLRGKVVDNASSGGCFVGVDVATGTLRGNAMTFFDSGAEVFNTHPDTGTVFDGYQIPYFDEVVALVLEAVKYFPDRMVGWDVGITPDGPVLIEANHAYHIGMSEMAYGGYRKNPVFREILAKYTR